MTCQHTNSRVINVKAYDAEPRPPARPGFRFLIYRRRECKDCGEWFTTYELSEDQAKELAHNC